MEEKLANFSDLKWWAWQGLNLRPLRCQRNAYSRFAQKTVTLWRANKRTSREQTTIFGQVYRKVTATLGAVA